MLYTNCRFSVQGSAVMTGVNIPTIAYELLLILLISLSFKHDVLKQDKRLHAAFPDN